MLAAAAAVALCALSAVAQPEASKATDDFNFAAWLHNSGKYGLAAEAYENFLKNYPDHSRAAEARFGLAQALFQQDRFREASEHYERLLKSAPDFPQTAEALFQLGQCRAALGAFAEARSALADLRKRFPDHYLADWALAREAAALISSGQPAAAEPLLQEFLDRYTPAGQSPEKSPAVQAMLKRMESAGVKTPDAFLNLVERTAYLVPLAAFNQQQFEKARDGFRSFLNRYPAGRMADEARFRLAQTLFRLESWAEAATLYEQVARGKSDFAESAAFERGLALHKAGRPKDAAEAFADMTKRFPNSAQAPRARLYSGSFLIEAGAASEAIARLEPLASQTNAPADEAAYWLAIALLRAGKPAEAETRIRDLLQRFPKSTIAADAQLALGEALLAQGRQEAAADTYRQFARAYPEAAETPQALVAAAAALHRAGRYAESDAVCRDLLKRSVGEPLRSQTLLLSGENRFLQKQYDPAAEAYRALVEAAGAPPDRVARARYRLAWIHRHGGRPDAALQEIANMDAQAAGPVLAAEASYLRGLCLLQTGQPAEAIPALRAYLRSADPSRYGDDASLQLAAAHRRIGQIDEAADTLEKALKQFSGSELAPRLRYELAELYRERKQYAKAIEHYKVVASADPPGELSPYALHGVGLCQADQQRWTEAAETFAQVAARFAPSPVAADARYRQGVSLTRAGKWGDARQVFSALLAAAPPPDLARSAQVMMGTCLQQEKQWAEAAEAFQKAIEQYPAGEDQPRLYYEQAWSWREAGRTNESLKAFQELATRFPNAPLAADAFFYLAEARFQTPTAPETPAAQAKRLEEARRLYEQSLAASRDPRVADKALYRLAACHALGGQYAAAAAAYDRLVEEYAASDLCADALFHAGQSYVRAGDPAKGMERYRRLLEDRRFAGFRSLPEATIGLAEGHLMFDRPQEALKVLESFFKRFEKHPAAAQAWFLQGKAHYEAGDLKAALASFEQVPVLAPATDLAAEAQFYAGQVHQAREDFRAAAMAYLRVQALYPQSREWVAASLFEGAKCAERLGQPEEARKALEQVVKEYADTRWAALAAERLK